MRSPFAYTRFDCDKSLLEFCSLLYAVTQLLDSMPHNHSIYMATCYLSSFSPFN